MKFTKHAIHQIDHIYKCRTRTVRQNV